MVVEANQPTTAMTSEKISARPTTAPVARRAASVSPRPIAWPISTVAAIPKPKKVANIRNMMMFALAVAASALPPRNWPTHTELIDPDSVCSTFDASVGKAKRISVFAIGPSVRFMRPAPRAVWRGGTGAAAGSAAAATGVTDASSLTPAGPARRSGGRPRPPWRHGRRAPCRPLRAWRVRRTRDWSAARARQRCRSRLRAER